MDWKRGCYLFRIVATEILGKIEVLSFALE